MNDEPRFASARPPRRAAFRPLDGVPPMTLVASAGCHWPVHPTGDPMADVARFVCGAPLDRGVYCTAHRALAYVPPPKRRNRQDREFDHA